MTLTCENCGYEAPGRACSQCRESVPLWAKFCPHCGAPAKAKIKEKPESGGDPLAMENRRACPDGNCIGILGADGRCILCGEPGGEPSGSLPRG